MKNCKICGSEFEPKTTWAAYCSPACRLIGKNASNRAGRARKRAGIQYVPKTCERPVCTYPVHWLLRMAGLVVRYGNNAEINPMFQHCQRMHGIVTDAALKKFGDKV